MPELGGGGGFANLGNARKLATFFNECLPLELNMKIEDLVDRGVVVGYEIVVSCYQSVLVLLCYWSYLENSYQKQS